MSKEDAMRAYADELSSKQPRWIEFAGLAEAAPPDSTPADGGASTGMGSPAAVLASPAAPAARASALKASPGIRRGRIIREDDEDEDGWGSEAAAAPRAAAYVGRSPARRPGLLGAALQGPSPASVTVRVAGVPRRVVTRLEERLERMAELLSEEAERVRALERAVALSQSRAQGGAWSAAMTLTPWSSTSRGPAAGGGGAGGAAPSDVDPGSPPSTPSVVRGRGGADTLTPAAADALTSLCGQLESAVTEQQGVVGGQMSRMRRRLRALEDRLGVAAGEEEAGEEEAGEDDDGMSRLREDDDAASIAGRPLRRDDLLLSAGRGGDGPGSMPTPGGRSVPGGASRVAPGTRRGLGLLLQAMPPSVRPAVVWGWEVVSWLGSSWSRLVLTCLVTWAVWSWLRQRALNATRALQRR